MNGACFWQVMALNLAAMATLFSLGLVKRFAPRIYPSPPTFIVRLIAPAIFAILAIAFLAGSGRIAVVAVIAVGAPLALSTRMKTFSSRPRR